MRRLHRRRPARPREHLGRPARREAADDPGDTSRELPEPTLQAVWEYLTEFLPALPEPVRASWGAAVPVPPDAPLLDRVVGLAGRKP